MKHLFLIFFIGISISLHTGQLQAQSLEVGLGFGLSTYDGELTPPTLIGRFFILEPGVTVFSKYNFNRYLTGRFSFVATSIRGDDAKSNSPWRERRNLSFHTQIYELALMGEWNIFGFFPNKEGNSFTPYLFGGIAFFHFDPTTIFNGEVVRLQPLGTEGQGLPQFPDRDFYSLYQISIPFGGGLKWAVSDRLTISGEIGWRKTFTDYLDDVSTTYVPYDVLLENRGELTAQVARRAWQVTGIAPEDYVPRDHERRQRGSPGTMDWYITGFVKLSYQLYMSDLTANRTNCKF